MGDKQIEKIRKGIEDYRRSAGRFRIDEAEDAADRLTAYLLAFNGIDRVTPAGSLRRGRETAGDLDLLVTGPGLRPAATPKPRSNTSPLIPASTTSSPRARTRSAFILRPACRSTFACCRRSATARRSSTSPAPRRTTSRSASAHSRWATPSANGHLPASTTNPPSPAATEEEIYAALQMDWMPPETARKPRRDRSRSAPHAPAAHRSLRHHAATCTCTPRQPTAATPSPRWLRPPSSAGSSTSPSPTTPKTWP